MVSSIQVQDQTMELLKKAKKRDNFPSYDELIKKLIKKDASKKSLAGFLARKKNYSKRELLFRLRDERDRF